MRKLWLIIFFATLIIALLAFIYLDSTGTRMFANLRLAITKTLHQCQMSVLRQLLRRLGRASSKGGSRIDSHPFHLHHYR